MYKKTSRNRGKWIIVLVLILAVCLFLLYHVSTGPSFLSDYYRSHGTYRVQEITGPFSIKIDTTDLEGNVGKVLYQDGGCTIYLDEVRLETLTETGRVFFRIDPRYSLSGVCLISPYDAGDANYLTQDLPTFRGAGIGSSLASLAGYQGDGTFVGYHLPHQEAVPLPDTITLEFSHLYLCTWS